MPSPRLWCRALPTVDGRFRAPLPAQQLQRLHDVVRQLQQVDQHGPVERLTNAVSPSLVGRQQFAAGKFLENLVGSAQLLRRKLPCIKHGQGREPGDREPGASLLLVCADPPEGDEAECGIGPEGERNFLLTVHAAMPTGCKSLETAEAPFAIRPRGAA